MGLFNSNVIDVVIGVVFMYLTLGIVCTAANEWVAAVTRRRGKMLRKGVTQLLANQPTQEDKNPEGLASEFYQHPLITKLHDGKRHPAYLSPRTFSTVMSDLLKSGEEPGPRSGAEALPDGQVRKSLLALLNPSENGNSETDGKRELETWYNESMDRVSGWYKRRTQLWTIGIAFVVTLGANANTIHFVRQLRADPVLRTAVMEEAKVRAQKPRPNVSVEYQDEDDPTNPTVIRNEGNRLSEKEQQQLGQLLGWHGSWRDNLKPETFLGWLLTILALSMGAPFWFDLLNRIMRVRYTGRSPDESAKPPEKPDDPTRA